MKTIGESMSWEVTRRDPPHATYKSYNLKIILNPCSASIRHIWLTACDMISDDPQMVYQAPRDKLLELYWRGAARVITENYLRHYGVHDTGALRYLENVTMDFFFAELFGASVMHLSTQQRACGYEMASITRRRVGSIKACFDIPGVEDGLLQHSMKIINLGKAKGWILDASDRFYKD